MLSTCLLRKHSLISNEKSEIANIYIYIYTFFFNVAFKSTSQNYLTVFWIIIERYANFYKLLGLLITEVFSASTVRIL